MEDFPPNSHKARAGQQKPRPKIESVVSSASVRRKRPSLGRQFKNTFLGGDIHSTRDYVVMHVIIPMIKDLLSEAMHATTDRMVYGGDRPGRRRSMMGGPPSGPGGIVNYSKISGGRPSAGSGGVSSVSSTSRARQEFDEIVLSDRREAEEVLERLFDLVSQFEVATVGDLYGLVGIRAEHTDEKWGWTDMTGAHIDRLRNGDFLLDLPKPEVL